MNEPPYLTLANAQVSYGDKIIFSDLNLTLGKRQRICLVGRNGCGKSSLMRALAGQIDFDDGNLYIEPHVTLGFLPQEAIPSLAKTVKDHVLAGSTASKKIESYEADAILDQIQLSPEKPMDDLSGGERRRADLARVLALDSDILLLDEPTNHLDISGIEWLENHLKSFKGSLLLISHDRLFLENISTHTFWMDRGKLHVNQKGFKEFDTWSDLILLAEEKELIRLNKKLAQETDWLHKGVTARRKRNQGRLKRLQLLREKKKHSTNARGRIVIPPPTPDSESKMVIEAIGLCKSFDTEQGLLPIVKDFSIRLLRGDRLGIIGNNGAGKTTLLKLLLGDLKADTGKIRRAKHLSIAYADQARANLNPKLNLWETLCDQGGDHIMIHGQPRHVVAYLKDFLFTDRQVFSPVGTLSGGEKNRLLLAKILTQPSSILVLDEPTNDLDMDTLDVLIDILSDYDGTLIIVSHDRYFIDRLVTSTLIMNGNADTQEYVGGYTENQQYLKHAVPVERKPQLPKKATQQPTAPKKLSYKFIHEQECLSSNIESLQKEIATLEEKLSDESLYLKNPQEFSSISNTFSEKKHQLQEAELRWLAIELMKEEFTK
ncbi:MAG: hypothetical protein BGO28_01505 [Alphaproteobacteria bacterium 43-37]|nr:MAG: hypothetical protein BGO28_01505 [Alphaproteobacteria bacterium 43-37]